MKEYFERGHNQPQDEELFRELSDKIRIEEDAAQAKANRNYREEQEDLRILAWI